MAKKFTDLEAHILKVTKYWEISKIKPETPKLIFDLKI
jgi:hypothetical protein